MSFTLRQELVGTARTSTPTSASQPRILRPPPEQALLRLSQAAADFMLKLKSRGLEKATLDEYRTALWYFIEFVGCDCPTTELAADTPGKFLDWLRNTPIATRKAKTRPTEFTAAALSAFFAWPPRRGKTESYRRETTIGKYFRHAAPFFEFLGLPTDLPKRGDGKRPTPVAMPPLVPSGDTISGWWIDCLTARSMPAGTKRTHPPAAAERRTVVLIQAMVYLTGMRIEELLHARLGDLQGHWLLIRQTKTHRPRIVYLSRQALGIVAALHPAASQRLLFDAGDRRGARLVCGWAYGLSAYHTLVRDCTSHEEFRPRQKRHQLMRRRLATWMRRRDPDSEAAQLGHGGRGVVFTNYLDYLRPLPKLLERRRLPEPEKIAAAAAGFKWPPEISAFRGRPDQLCEEMDRIANCRQG